MINKTKGMPKPKMPPKILSWRCKRHLELWHYEQENEFKVITRLGKNIFFVEFEQMEEIMAEFKEIVKLKSGKVQKND